MQQNSNRPVSESTPSDTDHPKRAFQQPKLTFVKPELVRQGDFTQITAGFFGTFTP